MNKFAFVDIETNGSNFVKDEIIEVGILIYENGQLIKTYNQLFKPFKRVPKFIQNLTGIKPAMLLEMPRFKMEAEKIFHLLKDTTFVAHNVGFDYNFLKHHLSVYGFQLNTDKLCSIQISKKLFPDSVKHNLDAVIANLNFEISSDRRHRALGDCEVILELWKQYESTTDARQQESFLKAYKHKKLQLKVVEQIKSIPRKSGIYKFFIGSECILVGRSRNLHNRVKQIFYKANRSLQQELFSQVSDISFELCDSEFESQIREIATHKKLQPKLSKLKFKKFFVSLCEPATSLECHPVTTLINGVFFNKKSYNADDDILELENLLQVEKLGGKLPLWPEKLLLIRSGDKKLLVFYNYTFLAIVEDPKQADKSLISTQTVDLKTIKIVINYLASYEKANIIWKDLN